MAGAVAEALFPEAVDAFLRYVCVISIPEGAQIPAYICTFLACQELLEYTVPALAGTLKLDMTGLSLARLRSEVKKLDERVKRLQQAHLKTAEDHFTSANSEYNAKEFSKAYDSFRKVETESSMASYSGEILEEMASGRFLHFISRLYISMYNDSTGQLTTYNDLNAGLKRDLSVLARKDADMLFSKVQENKKERKVKRMFEKQAGRIDVGEEVLNLHLRITFPFILETARADNNNMQLLLQEVAPYLPAGRKHSASYLNRSILTAFKTKVAKGCWVIQADVFSGKCILCGDVIRGQFERKVLDHLRGEGAIEQYAGHRDRRQCTQHINAEVLQEKPMETCVKCKRPILGVATIRLSLSGCKEESTVLYGHEFGTFHASCSGNSEFILGPLRELTGETAETAL